MSGDAVEAVNEMGADIPNPGDGMPLGDQPFKMPSKEELLAALDSMGLGDSEKEELRRALMDDGSSPFSIEQSWTSQSIILICFVLLMVSFFAFLFHRLYKTQTDKERKREEKRELKMSKRKKK